MKDSQFTAAMAGILAVFLGLVLAMCLLNAGQSLELVFLYLIGYALTVVVLCAWAVGELFLRGSSDEEAARLSKRDFAKRVFLFGSVAVVWIVIWILEMVYFGSGAVGYEFLLWAMLTMAGFMAVYAVPFFIRKWTSYPTGLVMSLGFGAALTVILLYATETLRVWYP